MKTKTWHTPTPGASYSNKPAWLEQRRGGLTATQVREVAQGSGSAKRKIMLEKLTGNFENLDGNRYVDRGNIREPIIAAYLADNFDIEPCDLVYAGADPRHLASPDGLSVDFDADRITSEIKTSKHDLTPGTIVGNTLQEIDPASHFARTGYYDQMQWQMHVMGGERVLFAWEQHDDNWPDPAPLHDRPLWCWVMRNDERIAELVEVAERFFVELDAARVDTLAPISESNVDPEIVDLVHQLLVHRDAEAVAKAQKESAWEKLQAKLMPTKTVNDDTKLELAEAVVTVSTKESGGGFTDVVDYEGMEKRAPRLVAQYAGLKDRYTVRKPVPKTASTRLSVVARKKEIK